MRVSPARPIGFVFAVVGGLACGLLGSFVHGYRFHGWPLGLIAALGLLLSVLVTSGLLAGTRAGAAVAAVCWLAMVVLLSSPRPEGDLIVPGSGLGYAWLLGGMVVGVVGVLWPYPSRSQDPSGGAAQGR